MKAFNGNEFLQKQACQIEFSNGKQFVVREVTATTMELMDKLKDNNGIEPIREVMASLCGCTPEDLSTLGLVELKGALDFLTESLFSSK